MKMILLSLFLWFSASIFSTYAENPPFCGSQLAENVIRFSGRLGIDESLDVVRPAQKDYGSPEIDYWMYRFENESFESLQKSLEGKPVSYVLDPEGKRLLVANDEVVQAMYQGLHILKRRFPDKDLKISYYLKENFEDKAPENFNAFLLENDLINLQTKGESIPMEKLPQTLRDMERDYYRGLAWVLKEAGVYKGNDAPFAEGKWAQKLREEFPDLKKAWEEESVNGALKLVKENYDKFKGLPGFREEGFKVSQARKNLKPIKKALGWKHKNLLNIQEAYRVTIPGQPNFGRPRVNYLLDKFRTKSFEDLQRYLDQRPIPYVITPDGKRMISDRHHMFEALHLAEEIFEKRFPGRQLDISYAFQKSFEGKGRDKFKQFMEKRNLVLLSDKGEPITWEKLPTHFGDMGDDYYRGIAWVLKKAGMVDNSATPFMEFKWGDVLRKEMPNLTKRWEWDSINEVIDFVHANPSKFKGLPGFKERQVSKEVAHDNLKKFGKVLGWNEKKVLTLDEAFDVTVPGQYNFGRPRVDFLLHKFKNESWESIQKYLDERPIPYVVTPDGKRMISDRHHLFVALKKGERILKERFPDKDINVSYLFLKTFKDKKPKKFKKWLEDNKLVLLSSRGENKGWDNLPRSFDRMGDDYFRGIAWVLKKTKVVQNTTVPFAEFRWADTLRTKFPNLEEKWNWEQMKEVISYIKANPDEFKGLPGFDSNMPSLEKAEDNFQKYKEVLGW